MHELIKKYLGEPSRRESTPQLVLADSQTLKLYEELQKQKNKILYQIASESGSLMVKVRTYFEHNIVGRYNRLRGKEGNYYPDMDDLMGREAKKLLKEIGRLETKLNKNQQNYDKLFDLQGKTIALMRESYDLSEENRPAYLEVRRDLIGLEKIIAGSSLGTDEYMRAIEAEHNARGKFFDHASLYLINKAQMITQDQKNRVYRNLLNLIGMTDMCARQRLNTYKALQETAQTFAEVVGTIEKVAKKTSGMEHNVNNIRKLTDSYKDIMLRLKEINQRFMESTVGPELAYQAEAAAGYDV